MVQQNTNPFLQEGDDNPFLRFLEGQSPEAFLFGQLPDQPSLGVQGFVQQMTRPLVNRFMGQLAKQTTRGEAPDLQFRDFLSQNFDLGREFRRNTPADAGLRSPARFLF